MAKDDFGEFVRKSRGAHQKRLRETLEILNAVVDATVNEDGGFTFHFNRELTSKEYVRISELSMNHSAFTLTPELLVRFLALASEEDGFPNEFAFVLRKAPHLASQQMLDFAFDRAEKFVLKYADNPHMMGMLEHFADMIYQLRPDLLPSGKERAFIILAEKGEGSRKARFASFYEQMSTPFKGIKPN